MKNKHLKYAVPFLTFMVGGSLALREFTQLRYTYRTVEPIDIREETKKIGIEMKDPSETSLEKQYEELKQVDFDKWENVRIPRPKGWEESQ